MKAKYAIIIGEDEVKNGYLIIKDLESGEQMAKNIQDFLEGFK
jgi:histidyl-tRNA synthetase